MIKRKKTKFVFNFKISEIKRQNLHFAVTYKEAGAIEIYKDVLRWSEINKPTPEIEVLKMEILKRDKKVLNLNQKNSKKLLNILDMYNNTGLLYNEIEPATAPAEKDIIFCISLYFAIHPKFNRSEISYKFYLNNIAIKRNFLLLINNPKEREIFTSFLNDQKSKVQISKDLTNHTTKGVYIINKNLKLLVSAILQDHKNGLLEVKEYKKPPTKREINRKANEYLKKIGSSIRIPLRKPSAKEAFKKWQKTNLPAKQPKKQ